MKLKNRITWLKWNFIMHSIQVIKPGYCDSIQDLGRFGYASIGVPVSGVMDALSAKMANALIRNSQQNAVLEMALIGPVLMFQKEAVIAISGADMSPKLNDIPVKMQTKLAVKTGDILSFGKAIYGCRSYLAVKNGFRTDKKLNSYAAFNGITDLVILKKGVIIPIGKQLKIFRFGHSSIKVDRQHFNNEVLDAYKGPEFELLTPKQQDILLTDGFQIVKNTRMAYQFADVPSMAHKCEILTSAVMPGTVQLTQSGKLMALMKDCQTTGGYPRILQLSDEAIAVLAQKNTCQKIKFKIIHL